MPASETVATAAFFVAQATFRPVSRVPSASRASAVRDADAPTPTLKVLGTTTTDATAVRFGSSVSLLQDNRMASSTPVPSARAALGATRTRDRKWDMSY